MTKILHEWIFCWFILISVEVIPWPLSEGWNWFGLYRSQVTWAKIKKKLSKFQVLGSMVAGLQHLLLVEFHYLAVAVPLQKQAKRLKTCERRPEVDRLDGQWACWLIGLMVDRLDGWWAQWLIGLMVDRLDGR